MWFLRKWDVCVGGFWHCVWCVWCWNVFVECGVFYLCVVCGRVVHYDCFYDIVHCMYVWDLFHLACFTMLYLLDWLLLPEYHRPDSMYIRQLLPIVRLILPDPVRGRLLLHDPRDAAGLHGE